MPRDGAITFGDLVSKLDALEVACEKCGRRDAGLAVRRLADDRDTAQVEYRGARWSEGDVCLD